MLWVLVALLSVTALGALIIVAVDWLLNFNRNMRRYHIGRWNSDEEWSRAVIGCAKKWLRRVPTVPKTDSVRYVLLDMLCGDYRNATIQSWQTASLVLGLTECDDEENTRQIQQWVDSVLTTAGRWHTPVKKVDFAMQAFALLYSARDYKAIRPAMDEVIAILEENLCADGMISYSQGAETPIRYVDTLGMVCPFLAAYGVHYDQPKYTGMAIEQLERFRAFGLWDGTSLPCHAFNVQNGVPLGVYGWGRGTAWYFLGLVDTWLQLPDGDEKKTLQQWVLEAAESYWIYQKPDGGFHTILAGGGQYDSSVTAAMAYFYQVCGQCFSNEQYLAVSDRCLEKLKGLTMRDGAIDCCQGDTHGIGQFSSVFDVMPFAQGLAVRTLALKERKIHV